MVVGGSLSDFSLGASCAKKAIQLLADILLAVMSASYGQRRSPAVFCWRENLRHLGYLLVPLAAAALRPRFRTQVAEVRRREGIREG
jgi:hypothetical protein